MADRVDGVAASRRRVRTGGHCDHSYLSDRFGWIQSHHCRIDHDVLPGRDSHHFIWIVCRAFLYSGFTRECDRRLLVGLMVGTRSGSRWERRITCTPETSLYFLQSLYFVYAGNFSQAGNDGLKMFQVCDVENNFHAGLTVGRMRRDVFDVALSVANHSGDALQHAEAIVTEDGQLHGIRSRRALVASPLDLDLAFRFIH